MNESLIAAIGFIVGMLVSFMICLISYLGNKNY